MTRDWLIALAALASSALTMLISALVRNATESTKATIEDISRFRTELLDQIAAMKLELREVQTEVDKWKERYWRLYGFLVSWCSKEGIPVPVFHDENDNPKLSDNPQLNDNED